MLFTYLVLASIFLLCHLLTAQACQHLWVYVVRGHQADWLLEQISLDSAKVQLYKNTQIQCFQCWSTPEMKTLKSYFCWFIKQKVASILTLRKFSFPLDWVGGCFNFVVQNFHFVDLTRAKVNNEHFYLFSSFSSPPNVGCLRRIKLQTCKD